MIKYNSVNIIKLLVRYVTIILIGINVLSMDAAAQSTQQMVRMAKITVDPAQLEQYNAALTLQMNSAIRLEPGVLSYYAVADKKVPSHITIIEVYADSAAYQHHITTPHFLQYKATVKDMVKSLELVDLTVVGIARKPGM